MAVDTLDSHPATATSSLVSPRLSSNINVAVDVCKAHSHRHAQPRTRVCVCVCTHTKAHQHTSQSLNNLVGDKYAMCLEELF